MSRENSLLIRFKQDALSLLDTRPADEWEWLFVMRHHGVPTRLMDWTENPLVGLYFAVSDQEQKNQDGALWHLLPTELNKLANLPISHENELPGFGDTEILRNYLPSTLSNEVKSEMLPVAALAPRNTRRMQAQQGVFTITHREPLALDCLSSTQHVWRLVIPHRAKPRLKAELEALNVRSSNLFPELDQVAQRALEAIK